MLDAKKILERANVLYACKKLRKKETDLGYVAPEALPKIQTDGVKCVLEALVEALNAQRQY